MVEQWIENDLSGRINPCDYYLLLSAKHAKLWHESDRSGPAFQLIALDFAPQRGAVDTQGLSASAPVAVVPTQDS
jgi:hypothetical protein